MTSIIIYSQSHTAFPCHRSLKERGADGRYSRVYYHVWYMLLLMDELLPRCHFWRSVPSLSPCLLPLGLQPLRVAVNPPCLPSHSFTGRRSIAHCYDIPSLIYNLPLFRHFLSPENVSRTQFPHSQPKCIQPNTKQPPTLHIQDAPQCLLASVFVSLLTSSALHHQPFQTRPHHPPLSCVRHPHTLLTRSWLPPRGLT